MLRTVTQPGIFDETLFSRRKIVPPSVYIRAMHPKTEIKPTPEAVAKILSLGWAGQLKIHGHRAQIHLPADSEKDVIVYNRQGRPHGKLLPDNDRRGTPPDPSA